MCGRVAAEAIFAVPSFAVSKAHFYGQLGPDLSFRDLSNRTFTRHLKTVIAYKNLQLYL